MTNKHNPVDFSVAGIHSCRAGFSSVFPIHPGQVPRWTSVAWLILGLSLQPTTLWAARVIQSRVLPPQEFEVDQRISRRDLAHGLLGNPDQGCEIPGRSVEPGLRKLSICPVEVRVVVEPGDELRDIAFATRGIGGAYGALWLARANGLGTLRGIRPGDILVVPPYVPRPPEHAMLRSWIAIGLQNYRFNASRGGINQQQEDRDALEPSIVAAASRRPTPGASSRRDQRPVKSAPDAPQEIVKLAGLPVRGNKVTIHGPEDRTVVRERSHEPIHQDVRVPSRKPIVNEPVASPAQRVAATRRGPTEQGHSKRSAVLETDVDALGFVAAMVPSGRRAQTRDVNPYRGAVYYSSREPVATGTRQQSAEPQMAAQAEGPSRSSELEQNSRDGIGGVEKLLELRPLIHKPGESLAWARRQMVDPDRVFTEEPSHLEESLFKNEFASGMPVRRAVETWEDTDAADSRSFSGDAANPRLHHAGSLDGSTLAAPPVRIGAP